MHISKHKHYGRIKPVSLGDYTAWRIFMLYGLAALFLVAARANGADAPKYQQIKGKALRAVFSDTLMVGEYRQYRDETKTYNYSEYHHKNGTTDYVEGRKKEDGRWKIVGDDKICYKYPNSDYYTGTYCFIVYKSEGCYYKYSPFDMSWRSGRPKNWDRWSSRAIRKGHGGSCDDPLG